MKIGETKKDKKERRRGMQMTERTKRKKKGEKENEEEEKEKEGKKENVEEEKEKERERRHSYLCFLSLLGDVETWFQLAKDIGEGIGWPDFL